jgi:hypothetical protein
LKHLSWFAAIIFLEVISVSRQRTVNAQADGDTDEYPSKY